MTGILHPWTGKSDRSPPEIQETCFSKEETRQCGLLTLETQGKVRYKHGHQGILRSAQIHIYSDYY